MVEVPDVQLDLGPVKVFAQAAEDLDASLGCGQSVLRASDIAERIDRADERARCLNLIPRLRVHGACTFVERDGLRASAALVQCLSPAPRCEAEQGRFPHYRGSRYRQVTQSERSPGVRTKCFVKSLLGGADEVPVDLGPVLCAPPGRIGAGKRLIDKLTEVRAQHHRIPMTAGSGIVGGLR